MICSRRGWSFGTARGTYFPCLYNFHALEFDIKGVGVLKMLDLHGCTHVLALKCSRKRIDNFYFRVDEVARVVRGDGEIMSQRRRRDEAILDGHGLASATEIGD